jgi:hypothetical protein
MVDVIENDEFIWIFYSRSYKIIDSNANAQTSQLGPCCGSKTARQRGHASSSRNIHASPSGKALVREGSTSSASSLWHMVHGMQLTQSDKHVSLSKLQSFESGAMSAQTKSAQTG